MEPGNAGAGAGHAHRLDILPPPSSPSHLTADERAAGAEPLLPAHLTVPTSTLALTAQLVSSALSAPRVVLPPPPPPVAASGADDLHFPQHGEADGDVDWDAPLAVLPRSPPPLGGSPAGVRLPASPLSVGLSPATTAASPPAPHAPPHRADGYTPLRAATPADLAWQMQALNTIAAATAAAAAVATTSDAEPSYDSPVAFPPRATRSPAAAAAAAAAATAAAAVTAAAAAAVGPAPAAVPPPALPQEASRASGGLVAMREAELVSELATLRQQLAASRAQLEVSVASHGDMVAVLRAQLDALRAVANHEHGEVIRLSALTASQDAKIVTLRAAVTEARQRGGEAATTIARLVAERGVLRDKLEEAITTPPPAVLAAIAAKVKATEDGAVAEARRKLAAASAETAAARSALLRQEAEVAVLRTERDDLRRRAAAAQRFTDALRATKETVETWIDRSLPPAAKAATTDAAPPAAPDVPTPHVAAAGGTASTSRLRQRMLLHAVRSSSPGSLPGSVRRAGSEFHARAAPPAPLAHLGATVAGLGTSVASVSVSRRGAPADGEARVGRSTSVPPRRPRRVSSVEGRPPLGWQAWRAAATPAGGLLPSSAAVTTALRVLMPERDGVEGASIHDSVTSDIAAAVGAPVPRPLHGTVRVARVYVARAGLAAYLLRATLRALEREGARRALQRWHFMAAERTLDARVEGELQARTADLTAAGAALAQRLAGEAARRGAAEADNAALRDAVAEGVAAVQETQRASTAAVRAARSECSAYASKLAASQRDCDTLRTSLTDLQSSYAVAVEELACATNTIGDLRSSSGRGAEGVNGFGSGSAGASPASARWASPARTTLAAPPTHAGGARGEPRPAASEPLSELQSRHPPLTPSLLPTVAATAAVRQRIATPPSSASPAPAAAPPVAVAPPPSVGTIQLSAPPAPAVTATVVHPTSPSPAAAVAPFAHHPDDHIPATLSRPPPSAKRYATPRGPPPPPPTSAPAVASTPLPPTPRRPSALPPVVAPVTPAVAAAVAPLSALTAPPAPATPGSSFSAALASLHHSMDTMAARLRARDAFDA